MTMKLKNIRFSDGLGGKNRINCLFFVTGILTAYLDFLTYPLASFGILIVLYLIINRENIKIDRVKSLLCKMFLWGFGYGGMWGGKWLVGSILMKRNMFADALNQTLLRTSSGGLNETEFSRLDAVCKNLSIFLNWPFLIVFLLMAGYFLFQLRKLTVRTVSQNAALIFFLIVAAILPVGWIMIVANHSYEHYWFTYKEFSVSSLALLSLAIYLKTMSNHN